MVPHRLALDYGTSNTVAVIRRPDGAVRPLLFDSSPLLSSAVFAGSDGRIRIGGDAGRRSRVGPARVEPNPKRRGDELEVLLRGRPVLVAELVAAVLRRGGPPAAPRRPRP